MKITALATLFSVFQIAIAGAPASEALPPAFTPEYIAGITSLIAESPLEANKKIISTTLTAYSSTPDQTDDTPCITASGFNVCEYGHVKNVVAANFLPIGTKVQIPSLFGDKIFVVEDRMHERFSDRMDIWFPDRTSAKKFGKRTATVIVYES